MPRRRIIVDLSDRHLYLLEDNRVVRGFLVGIGKILTRTPEGEYQIINKESNPGGPYGVFWMGLSRPGYGIHGTNNPASIGKMVSKGCIRMYNEDVLQLESLVSVGTRVTIRA
jgi:lipoprotein-anchoring transpeptidase ErfK/SrfK